MARQSIKAFIIITALFALTILPAERALCFNVYLKNGKTIDALEMREERNLIVLKLTHGYEIGMPKDDVEWKSTEESLKKHNERIKKDEEYKKLTKELEEKEKVEVPDIFSSFIYEKRGMQTVFTEDEATRLIDLGEKNAAKLNGILKAYSFYNEYLPSVVYTKRLRLVLTGVEKERSKKPVSPTEVQSILQDSSLLVLLVLTADDPDFFVDAELYLDQEGKKILPFNSRFPAKGDRTTNWPSSPAYVWKVLANFSYNSIDLQKAGKLVVRKKDFYREFTIDFTSFR